MRGEVWVWDGVDEGCRQEFKVGLPSVSYVSELVVCLARKPISNP